MNKKAGITYTRSMQVIEFDKKHTRVYEVSKLEESYKAVMRHLEYITTSPIKNFRGIVGRKIASVTTKIVTVLRMLTRSRHTKFLSLFKSAKTRSDIIATFLAVLELSKNDRITINDSGEEIYIDVSEKREKHGV